MSLNEKPSGERIHIGFFGIRNAGKSSVVNAVTGQELSLVSEIRGTTTDPVQKAMELLPLGPVVIIDTPGIDDEGQLGEMRVRRARQILNKTDIAILVADIQKGLQSADLELCALFQEKEIPYILVWNKTDLAPAGESAGCPDGISPAAVRSVSALTGAGIYELKEQIGALAGNAKNDRKLVGDLISPGDVVVLVTPIDESAPKGRMILPQQQMIRDVLDHDAINVVVQDTGLEKALASLQQKPSMVITDSQAFGKVSPIVPEEIPLTSFSILFARYKGSLEPLVKGAAALRSLKDGDRVLICEGCTHHRQCNDIGTVKLPGWIRGFTGRELQFAFTSGIDFPEDLSGYALVVHCGGCMLNEREMKSRIRHAADEGIPITNYGIAIAMMHGILRRSLSPFPDLQELLG